MSPRSATTSSGWRAGEDLPPRRTARTVEERRAREQMVGDMWTAAASLDQIGRALGVRNPSSVIYRMRHNGWDLLHRCKAPIRRVPRGA